MARPRETLQMQLPSLRPREGADLLQLRALLEGRGWRAAVPDALPENVLVRLAHDFRSIECSLCDRAKDDEQELPSLAPAILVVMHLLLHHPAREFPADNVTLSETGMMRALQVYQWGLEREIVNRIVGLAPRGQSESLLDGLWRCAHD